tara:strand:- start:2669 stop:2968 length:300 start_codon:yes stop_codon:yes gene_type:complete
MGRAIDMENDIQILKLKIEKLENTVRGMVSKLDSLDEKSSKTKHVDLVEDVKVEEDLGSVITGEYKNEDKEEKADNEGDDTSSGKSNKRSSSSSKKTNK